MSDPITHLGLLIATFRNSGVKHIQVQVFEFIEGMGANGDLYAVQASDGVALSFLQHQLNRLGSGIKIEIPPGGLY